MLTADHVAQAYERIGPYIHKTPLLRSTTLENLINHKLKQHDPFLPNLQIIFKAEIFQKSGAFKYRGATNALLSLPKEVLQRGVITHSSGNHAGALAKAATERCVPCTVIMPDNSSATKVAAVRGYGADVIFCKPSEREMTFDKVQAERKLSFIHPYDNEHIISGQGTVMYEFRNQADDVGLTLDAVIVPVGGGGLLSGCCLARGESVIFGAEPSLNADAHESLHSDQRVPELNDEQRATIADGLRTPLGSRNYAIIKQGVRDILLVSEKGIAEAMRTTMERLKVVIEPSAAVGVAALLEPSDSFLAWLNEKKELQADVRVGVILEGGNVEFGQTMPWIQN